MIFILSQNNSEGEEGQPIGNIFDSDENKSAAAYSVKVSIQFWVVIILLVLSFGAKMFREDFCNNFQEDVINLKLEQIKQTYQSNAGLRQARDEQPESPIEVQTSAASAGGKSP